jgi:hypothetical protein
MPRPLHLSALLLVASALTIQPWQIHDLGPLRGQVALAHGNGGGTGHGNGGGEGHADAGDASGQANAHATDEHATALGDAVADAAPMSVPGLHDHLHAILGALDAAHASPAAQAHAAPHSRVARITAYYHSMLVALAMPAITPQQVVARDDAIATARSTELAPAANKSLSPAVVAKVDSLLGLPPSNPSLGVTTPAW